MTEKTTNKKAYDLSSLDTVTAANNGVDVELKHPVTKVPLGMFINISGTDSDVYRESMRGRRNKRLSKVQVGGGADSTAEEIDAEAIETLVDCTNGWNLVLEGKEVPFSRKTAREFYSKKYPWMAEQIDKAMGDRGNFLK